MKKIFNQTVLYSSKEIIQKCEELSKKSWRKNMANKTQILKILGDWQDVVDDCRATVSKPPLGKEPSTKFKKSILISEHSPIRDIIFRWKWSGIKSWVATHWVRHHWECRVSTQRNDRQDKYDRNKAPQDAPVDFVEGSLPRGGLLTVARQSSTTSCQSPRILSI